LTVETLGFSSVAKQVAYGPYAPHVKKIRKFFRCDFSIPVSFHNFPSTISHYQPQACCDA